VGPGTGSYGGRREQPKVMRYEQKGQGQDPCSLHSFPDSFF
jgi:hypothetical protein